MNREAYQTLREDRLLGPIVEETGHVEIGPADDPFERLTISIINQQLSVASANAIQDRLFERIEITPEGIRAASPADLRESGLSGQKIEYLKELAAVYLETPLTVEYFAEMDDDAVLGELTEIRGIGMWTGKMFLMFCLGREDVFPVEDLGIRHGMEHLYDEELSRVEMVARAERWTPYRSYAARYIWRISDD